MRIRQVHLHVDALVLRGFPPREGTLLATSFRAELAHQLAHAVPCQSLVTSRALDRLPPHTYSLSSARPQAAGRLAARHIVRGLTR